MWSRLFNLFVIKLFVLQASAFAIPQKPLKQAQLAAAVQALRSMSPEEQEKLFLTVIPMIHQDDIEELTKDKNLWRETIKNLSVENDALHINIDNQTVKLSEINLINRTANYNGKSFDFRKSIKENILYMTGPVTTTSLMDFIIPQAHASWKLLLDPTKYKAWLKIAAGALVAILALVGISIPYLNIENTEATVQEVQMGDMVTQVNEDCKNTKFKIKKSKLGETPQLTTDFIQKLKSKYQALDNAVREGQKMALSKEQMKLLTDTKNCYEEAIELVSVHDPGVQDSSSRDVKEVQKNQNKQPGPKSKATKQ
jgi:hypothetical protein